MLQLHVGFSRKIVPPKTGWLLIDDEVPKIRNAKIFDPLNDSFNPLADLDYRKACDIVDIFDAIFSRGDTTLTKDTGLDFLADALEGKPKSFDRLIPVPDKRSTPGHVWAYSKVRKILRSPVLRRVLCNESNINFGPLSNPKAKIAARINRAELGDFDSLVLGLFLISQFRGNVIVPDFGFYGRPLHVNLIRENRLIAGVNTLSELPEKLQQALLLIPEKVASRATFDDAETLAQYARLAPGTVAFTAFVDGAMA